MRLTLTLLFLAAPATISSATLGVVVVTVPPYALRLPAQVASWYHMPHQRTASGAPYGGMTAASRTLPRGGRNTHPLPDRGRYENDPSATHPEPWATGTGAEICGLDEEISAAGIEGIGQGLGG